MVNENALKAAASKLRDICDTDEPCEDILRLGYTKVASALIEAYEAAKEPLLLKKIAKEACVREEVAMWVLKAIGANYD